MAKVTGPLLSLGASGSIAKTIVVSKWRGKTYIRQHVIPANPKTTGQLMTRTVFKLLTQMWKLSGPFQIAPWNLFAKGRPFLGLNAHLGQNLKVLRAEADMNFFIGSPAAKGGLAPETVVATTGVGSGEVKATVVAPTPPTGWTLVGARAVAFPNQDPELDFIGPIIEGEDVTDPFEITLAGLPVATDCQVSAWLEWTKENGDQAFGVSITDQATSGA